MSQLPTSSSFNPQHSSHFFGIKNSFIPEPCDRMFVDTDPAGEGESSDSGSDVDVDVSSIPDQISTEDARGLKSTLEKLKTQVAELKGYKSKAQLIDELAAKGIDAKDIPGKLKAIEEQQAAEDRIEQLKAELDAQKRAEIETLRQQQQEEVANLKLQIQAGERQKVLENVLAQGGGALADFTDFAGIASRFLEFDDNQKIKNIRPPLGTEGDTWYVDDEKQVGKVRPAKISDFLLAAKEGKYGKAIQSLLPPVNQASGAGLPGNYAGNGNKIVLRRSQLADMGKLNTEQLAAVKAGEYALLDG